MAETEGTNSHKTMGLGGYQGLFLALTLVVMIIIIITTKDLPTAIIVIGLITNFLIISSQLTLMGDRHVAIEENARGAKRRINRGLAASVTTGSPSPGAMLAEGFEDDPTDNTPAGGTDQFADAPLAAGAGLEDDSDPLVDFDGRPSKQAGDAPETRDLGYDNDTNGLFDADEAAAYQVRSRNVPERVWSVGPRRRAFVEKYTREELDNEENKAWWGRHEL